MSDLVLSLRRDIDLVEAADSQLSLRGPFVTVPIRQTSAGWRALLRQLADGGATESDLGRTLIEQDGPGAVITFYHMLRRLLEGGMLRQTLVVAGRPIATLVPSGPHAGPPAAPLADGQRVQLSRFACLRAEDGLLVESPLSNSRVLLHTPGMAALIGALARPHTASELAAAGELDAAAARVLLELLRRAALVVVLSDEGANPELVDPALGQWEFHDLLFHSRSRLGRHANPYGGTMPGRDTFAPLPAVKDYPDAPQIALPPVDLEALSGTEPSLTAVLERRQSLRSHAAAPLSLEQLGEFLYRTARVKQLFRGDDGVTMSRRPYPAGGALYELEIYPVVGRCAGLESGLYHYQPQRHALCRLAQPTPAVQQLLNEAALTAMLPEQPQILLAITARFQRVQWKYRSVAYALVLKHVGALYQTMYLVATAMGLAPCALGGGNADLFAAAAGLNYYAETTVGEFLLGTPAAQQHPIV